MNCQNCISKTPMGQGSVNSGYWIAAVRVYAPIAAGAQAGLPSSRNIPIAVKALSMACLLTYLVRTSAGLSVPKTLHSSISLLRTCCWIQRSVVSRCRSFPSPLRRQMPMAAVASEWTLIATVQPISLSSDLRPKAWADPYAIPCNSASPLLRETVLWVLAQCFIKQFPRKAVPPDVDLLVLWHPAKSVST